MLRFIKIFLTAITLLVNLMALNSCRQEAQKNNYIPIINCEDALCKSVLYDIEVSKYNLGLKVQEGFSPEEEIIKYCLTTNSECGAQIFSSLRKLIDYDSVRFKFLDDKYFIGDKESFLDNLARGSGTNALSKINDIENDVFEACNCK